MSTHDDDDRLLVVFWPEVQYPVKLHYKENLYGKWHHTLTQNILIVHHTSTHPASSNDNNSSFLTGFSIQNENHHSILYKKNPVPISCWINYDSTKFPHYDAILESINSNVTKPTYNDECSINYSLATSAILHSHKQNLLQIFKSTSSSSEFWNAVLVTLVDLCLGVLCYYYIIHPLFQNSPLFFLSQIKSVIQWLMDDPAGVKLNTPLTALLGSGCTMVLDLYEVTVFTIFRNLRPLILQDTMIITYFPFVIGLSLQLALVCDFVSIFVIKFLYVLCLYFGRLHHLQLNLLSTLWKLFVGKKYNVLRKRVDSLRKFDLNQLLVGTLLFTIVIFIVMTNFAFYVFFQSIYVITKVLCQLSLLSIIYMIQGFPYGKILNKMVIGVSFFPVGDNLYELQQEFKPLLNVMADSYRDKRRSVFGNKKVPSIGLWVKNVISGKIH